MEEKDFDQWNEKKKIVNFSNNLPLFQVGQIWWAQIGQNVATEVNGKGNDFVRPVVIIQDVYRDACLAVPLTSRMRVGNYYFNFKDTQGAEQCALLTQIRYIDGKRLKYRFAHIRDNDLNELRNSLCILIKK